MKYILLSAFSALFCITALAANEWKSYFKNAQIEIEYRYADCHDDINGIHQQKVFLRFTNLSAQKIGISFLKELTFSNSKSSSADGKIFELLLNANEIKEGNCQEKDQVMSLYSKQLNFSSTELKKFELKNITVKNIQ